VCVKQFGVCGATDTCGEGQTLTVEGGYAVCKKDSGGNNPGSKDEDYSLDISDSAVTVQCNEVKEVTVTYLKGEEKIEDASIKLASSDADCVNVADDVSTNKDGIGTIELKAKELGKDCTAEITVSAEGVDAQKINVTVEGKDCDGDDEMCHNNDDCADGEYCIEALYEVGNGDTDSVKVGEMFCSACPTDCDPTSQYPVCASSVHACAATASCPGGQVFQVKGNVAVCISGTVKTCNNDEDCESGYVCDANKVCAPDAKTCEKDTDCETGYVCKAKQCVADAKTCEKDTDCESGYVCKAKQCVADANACENDVDCETGYVCKAKQCVVDAKTCEKDTDCETGYVCKDKQCVADAKTCEKDTDCEAGYVCKDKQCVVEVYNEFKYVRIDDMSVACTLDKDGLCHVDDPGADIDAVVLAKVDNTLHYAVSVTGYQRSDGLKAGERFDQNIPAATDPTRALGQPDAFAAYPAVDGKCAYYIDAAKTVHPYVSLGGMGGYVVLEMANAIEAGDKIDVLEIGACDLQNTKDGGSQIAKAEEIQISISSTGENWKIVGKHSADSTNKGILSFTISSNMLN
jgi:hypothetical protein